MRAAFATGPADADLGYDVGFSDTALGNQKECASALKPSVTDQDVFFMHPSVEVVQRRSATELILLCFRLLFKIAPEFLVDGWVTPKFVI